MPQLICQSCSNGCVLTLTPRDARTVAVSGNKCLKGVAYAHRMHGAAMPGVYVAADPSVTYGADVLSAVFTAFGLEYARVFPGMFVQGSPERSVFRTVAADSRGRRWVVEQIPQHREMHKQNTARYMAAFSAAGLPVMAYASGTDGSPLQEIDGLWWQLQPFAQGIELDRSTYWNDGRRGELLAHLLADMYRVAEERRFDGPRFSLPQYVDELSQTIRSEQPELYEHVAPYVAWLSSELFSVYETLPFGFCHGDPHPANVIWGEDRIIALIDFEFAGTKPRLYDAALILGCVGSEAPGALDAAFLERFLAVLTERGVCSYNDRKMLFVLAAAIRFGWLSEWLRREDEEMIGFELFYLRHLKERAEKV